MVALRSPSRGHRTALVLVGGTAAAAWGSLAAADASAWGRYLDHDGLAASSLSPAAALWLFVAGWILMLAAMMLPTTYPLVSLFARVVGGRADGARLLMLLVAGYLAVWSAIGLGAYGADLALHAVVDRLPALERQAWMLGAGALALAGAYQLSGLKDRCLQACRSPRLVIFARWRGRAPAAEAFNLGAAHGWSCVGCCWALMLLMFALGAGNLGWMLALAAVMAGEKLWSRGPALSRPVGVALLVAAATVVMVSSGW